MVKNKNWEIPSPDLSKDDEDEDFYDEDFDDNEEKYASIENFENLEQEVINLYENSGPPLKHKILFFILIIFLAIKLQSWWLLLLLIFI